MADRYRWTLADVQSLRDKTQIVVNGLSAASMLVNTLIAQMSDDSEWTSDSKATFMAWMDLLRQFYEKMAADDIGKAAVQHLDTFSNSISTFEQNSTVHASLGAV